MRMLKAAVRQGIRVACTSSVRRRRQQKTFVVRCHSGTTSGTSSTTGGEREKKGLPRFYLNEGDTDLAAKSSVVTISGKEAVHAARVLRLKPNSQIEVCDGAGNIAKCVLTDCASNSKSISALVTETRFSAWNGTKWKVCVASGSVKGTRGDWLVEKLTELGAWQFQPLLTDHSPRMGGGTGRKAGRQNRSRKEKDDSGSSGREERWKRLAVAASKQCLRSHSLEILPATQLDNILLECESECSNGLILAAHQTGEPLLSVMNACEPLPDDSVGILIVGPEGDFSERELKLMKECQHVRMVGLGDLRLRLETAALALLSGVRLIEQKT